MNDGAGAASQLTDTERAETLELVERRFGIRASKYGASRLDDAVSKVLPGTGRETMAGLLASVDDDSNPRWLLELVEFLTVGETYFLRDPAQIAALRNTILPDAIERRTPERRLRLWSAGCSTGEEVYTLAILLDERKVGADWDLALVGTDVNRESLRVAREARYPAWSFRATPETVRDRYFEAVEGGWRLNEPMRRMARFAWSNLGADRLIPPLTDLDLIMCRNVTIYFDDVATQRLYQMLIGALAPGGWLMLGPSDPLPSDTSGLERVEVSDAVLWRRRSPAATVSPLRRERPTTTPIRRPVVRIAPRPVVAVPVSGKSIDLETGLLALEAGSAASAIEWLRRATFHEPNNAVAQFALARAYAGAGDRIRAQTTLLHTRRLLAPLAGEDLVPGSDSLSVETLRQTVATYLEEQGAA